MHLLAAQPGGVSDGSEAVDLGQTLAISSLFAADTELTLAQACSNGRQMGPKCARQHDALAHNMSVDLYVEDIITHAKLVPAHPWTWLLVCCDETAAIAQRGHPRRFCWHYQPDAELAALSTLDADAQHRLWQYLVHGGLENALTACRRRLV